MKIEGNELIIGGVVASIDRDNIDTDQIIPTEYLKSIKSLVLKIIYLMGGDILMKVN
jgi:3-isopropylmalate dehydratase small subunit